MTESTEKLVVNLTAPDQEPDVDEGKSRNRAVDRVISKPSGPGLLDLPPEIRLMIFRHLLVLPIRLSDYRYPGKLSPNLGILTVNKLVHTEAFDVLYKENRFDRWFWDPPSPIARYPRVVDTIQNIETEIFLDAESKDFENLPRYERRFVKVMHLFKNSSVTRRSLVLTLWIETSRVLRWVVRALGRFANFMTIELLLCDFCGPHNNFPEWCKYLKTALKPALGNAEEYEREREGWNASTKGLRFHPVDHQNDLKNRNDGDCDYLRIPLGWNETLTGADDSGRPIQE